MMFPVQHRCTSNGTAAQTDLSKHGLSPTIKSHIVCKHLTPFPPKNMIWVLVLRPKFDSWQPLDSCLTKDNYLLSRFFSLPIYRPVLSWLQIHQSGKQQIKTYIISNTLYMNVQQEIVYLQCRDDFQNKNVCRWGPV